MGNVVGPGDNPAGGPMGLPRLDGETVKDIAQQIWEYVWSAIVGVVEWVCNGIISMLETLKSGYDSLINSVFGVDRSGEVTTMTLTIDVIVGTIFVLSFFGIIRLWVWFLDVAPIL